MTVINMDLETLDIQGNSVGKTAIPKVFLGEINRHVIWEVVKAEMANKRQGTHSTKTKAQVRGGGAKPWRQKGTGRARQGSIRSPQWNGGGIVFGPTPRDYREAIPKKKKKAGYRNIIAEKIANNKVVVINELRFSEISTKKAFGGIKAVVEKAPFYEKYSEKKKLNSASNDNRRMITVVMDENDAATRKSMKNIPWIQGLHVDRLAAVPLFYTHGIIFTAKALDKLAKNVSAEKKEKDL